VAAEGVVFECSSIMLGALTKQLQLSGFLSPRPLPLYQRFKYNDIVKKVFRFRSPRWYNDSYSHYRCGVHICADSFLAYFLDELNDNIERIDLEGFVAP
jgi:hypothetical protein